MAKKKESDPLERVEGILEDIERECMGIDQCSTPDVLTQVINLTQAVRCLARIVA